MNEQNVFMKISELSSPKPISALNPRSEREEKIAKHKAWLMGITREHPNTNTHFRVAVYIRYFNQTKYENYLEYHKKQFMDIMESCPKWELVDIYIDEGPTAPAMESAPDWCRLLEDCQAGKVDLIITQKVSNVSSDMLELTFLARYFTSLKHPIGMYFISEDIYTLASYYKDDNKDKNFFFPTPDWQMLPDDEEEPRGLIE